MRKVLARESSGEKVKCRDKFFFGLNDIVVEDLVLAKVGTVGNADVLVNVTTPHKFTPDGLQPMPESTDAREELNEFHVVEVFVVRLPGTKKQFKSSTVDWFVLEFCSWIGCS